MLDHDGPLGKSETAAQEKNRTAIDLTFAQNEETDEDINSNYNPEADGSEWAPLQTVMPNKIKGAQELDRPNETKVILE